MPHCPKGARAYPSCPAPRSALNKCLHGRMTTCGAAGTGTNVTETMYARTDPTCTGKAEHSESYAAMVCDAPDTHFSRMAKCF